MLSGLLDCIPEACAVFLNEYIGRQGTIAVEFDRLMSELRLSIQFWKSKGCTV